MMNMIENILSKNNTLLFGLGGSLLLSLSLWFLMSGTCSSSEWVNCRSFGKMFEIVSIFLIWCPFLFFGSLLTYKLHEKVFRSWIYFALWWIPLSIVVIASSSTHARSYIFPSVQEQNAILFLGLFILISVIIIWVKWRRLK